MSHDNWATAQSIWRAWPHGHADIPAAGTCRRLRDALTGISAVRPDGGTLSH